MCVLAGFCHGHSYSASYKSIPKGDIYHETSAHRLQRSRPPLRQPPGFRRHRRTAAPIHARPRRQLSRSDADTAGASYRFAPRRRPGGPAGRFQASSRPGSTASWSRARRSNIRRKASKVWPATSASSSRSRAAAFMARARRPRSASIWKPICAGCSASSESRARNLFPPMAFKSVPSTAKRRWPAR
jgi:hypothetical protein